MNENTARTLKEGRKPTPLEPTKVYRTFLSYQKYLIIAIRRTPGDIQKTVCSKCLDATMNCVRSLSVAIRTYDKKVKLSSLNAFLREWDVSFDCIMIFMGVKVISKKQRNVLVDYREKIEGQIQALRRWCDEANDKSE